MSRPAAQTSPDTQDSTGADGLTTGSVELWEYRPGEEPPRPAPPPARDRDLGELQVLSSRAGQALVQAGVPFQAAVDLGSAWERLCAAGMGRTLVDRLGAGRMDPQLEAVFGQPWTIVEVAAMYLALVPTTSALDLCADAALLVCGEPVQGSGRFYDLAELRRRRTRGQLAAPPAVRAWIDQLLGNPELVELEECRHHLTHRTPRRHITYRADQRGAITLRELAEITTLHGVQGAQWRGSIADLVPRLVAFAEEQLELLCLAILAPRARR